MPQAAALALLLALSQRSIAAENRDSKDPSKEHAVQDEQYDAERMDRFVVLNEKLKTAVCDDAYISKAPSLDPIRDPKMEPEYHPGSVYYLVLPRQRSESELLSFLLGDSLAGVYSEFVRAQALLALKNHGLDQPAREHRFTAEQFGEVQSVLMGVKRRVSLDVCEGLVDYRRLQQLVNATPSRFLEARVGIAPDGFEASDGFLLEALDTERRFGRVGDRKAQGFLTGLLKKAFSRETRFLVPGWLESFEVQRLSVLSKQGSRLRMYRRVSNPLTNNTESIEVVSAQGLPLGVLYLSQTPTANDWTSYRSWSEAPEARTKQLETYRNRIQIDAVEALQRKPQLHDQVRNLQEFYKNLLQAYQLFPNEKQFDTYNKIGGKRVTLDEVTGSILGKEFLEVMREARVNASHVHLGLFKPDTKLHAIYAEYAERLNKLK